MSPTGPRLLTAIAVLSLAVAGCGGSKRTADTSGAATQTDTATVAPPSTTTATTSTPTTTTPSGPPLCRAAGLALAFIGQQGAAGHGEVAFSLRNTGSTSCRTFGYPGVLFLDSAGRPLPTHATRTTSDFAGSLSERAIVLAPGERSSFRMTLSHVSSSPCTTAAAIQVIPPDDTGSLRVSVEGGISECGGAATVSPLQPGTSAFA
jgi:hypothetical protein